MDCRATAHRVCLASSVIFVLACSVAPSGQESFSGNGQDTATGHVPEPPAEQTTTGAGGSTTESMGTGSETGNATVPGIFDLGVPEDVPAVDLCHVDDGLDAPAPCEDSGPPDAFSPAVEWTYSGDAEPYAIAVPLVANLTDDDGNGSVDLCDVPDVVVVTYAQLGAEGHLRVLDGATGTEHFALEPTVHPTVTPALGDIDGDGLVEIVSVTHGGAQLVSWSNEGDVQWQVDLDWPGHNWASIAIADLDNDGSPEIVAGNTVVDATGTVIAVGPAEPSTPDGPWFDSVPADLDGDGDLEVVLGHAAFHHDGTMYYEAEVLRPGFAQIANLDDDSDPEVLVTDDLGLTILDHEGNVQVGPLSPLGPPGDVYAYTRPAVIHDIDGDGEPEIGVSHITNFALFDSNLAVLWTAGVHDNTGTAGGTAFDFLGDSTAESMYADEQRLFVFDAAGGVELEEGRPSVTGVEYPVVADIDNDGSAEILVVGNGGTPGPDYPTLRAIRDAEDRWVPARRIWNQFNYHVTNVREDGTIPQHEAPHWEHLNTFRAQAQIMIDGGVCIPAG